MCLACGCGDLTALACPECGGRVILINEKAKCLSCGGSPAMDEMLPRPGHDDHHQDLDGVYQHADVDESARQELISKLQVLIPHWIEHNGEHATSFRTWAEQARAAGDRHLAAHIEEAAQKIEAASRDLEGLAQHLGGATGEHAHVDHDHVH